MVDIRKFYADVQRCLKHERANSTVYDGQKASKAVAALFVSYNKDLSAFAESLAEYWLKTYVEKSKDLSAEPTQENVDWLASVLSLIDGENDFAVQFSKKDWAEIADCVNAEANDLPMDVLSSIMTILVEKKVL